MYAMLLIFTMWDCKCTSRTLDDDGDDEEEEEAGLEIPI